VKSSVFSEFLHNCDRDVEERVAPGRGCSRQSSQRQRKDLPQRLVHARLFREMTSAVVDDDDRSRWRVPTSGIKLPSNTPFLWPTHHLKRPLDRLRRFCTIHGRYQRIDRPTDRQTERTRNL